MSNVQIFSNRPSFCTKQLSIDEILTLPRFNALVEADPSTSTTAAACGDPNLGALYCKNVLHQVIRCGGGRIDINFMQEMFPQMANPGMVNTKRWFNHYYCDPDFNIFAANEVVGSGPGEPVTFQVLKANHGGNGAYSLPVPGYQIIDKDTQTQFYVTAKNDDVNYAHRVTVVPSDPAVTAVISPNKQYLVLPARLIGGCSDTLLTNKMSSIGYTRVEHPLRLRNDWKICVDLLRGYEDKIQFAVIYDYQGQPMDSWDVYEAMQAREGLRMALNVLAFIGTPTTNPSLISNITSGLTIDADHTGFYGWIPTLKYGGGRVYNYNAADGFDMQADFEPIALYQDSRKYTKKFTAFHEAQFGFSIVDRQNKLVTNTDAGKFQWEAYQRLGSATGEDYLTAIAKLGIRSYTYQGFGLDLKLVDSWSDQRFVGGDNFSQTAIFVPQDGVTENGRPLQPIEFNTYGNGKWTGNFEEHFIDYRNAPGGEDAIGGWVAESINMTVHCPDQFILVNPVKAA